MRDHKEFFRTEGPSYVVDPEYSEITFNILYDMIRARLLDESSCPCGKCKGIDKKNTVGGVK